MPGMNTRDITAGDINARDIAARDVGARYGYLRYKQQLIVVGSRFSD